MRLRSPRASFDANVPRVGDSVIAHFLAPLVRFVACTHPHKTYGTRKAGEIYRILQPGDLPFVNPWGSSWEKGIGKGTTAPPFALYTAGSATNKLLDTVS